MRTLKEIRADLHAADEVVEGKCNDVGDSFTALHASIPEDPETEKSPSRMLAMATEAAQASRACSELAISILKFVALMNEYDQAADEFSSRAPHN